MTQYVGKELDIFAQAENWKRYWSAKIRPYVRGDVLEVGAGLGANTPFLKSDAVSSWTCLEPDRDLVKRLARTFSVTPPLADCQVETGTITSLSARRFDTILYIDVLEHIENDREELTHASSLLRDGGTIVVLSPAHQWLYSPFDRAIGHFRRYTRCSLCKCSPSDCTTEKVIYLDSIGIAASAVNRLFLRNSMPTFKQVIFWDRRLVPLSTWTDQLTMYSIGKSILGIWRKQKQATPYFDLSLRFPSERRETRIAGSTCH
jgi:Methyltransferase domain